MSRHIARGSIPTYYYGQNYLGSIDAILAAPLVAGFGDSVVALRVGSVALFCAFLCLNGLLARDLWGRGGGLLAALLLVFPGYAIWVYTYRANIALGSFATLGSAAVLMAMRGMGDRRASLDLRRLIFFGLVAGLGFWIHPMVMVYVLSVGAIWVLQSPEWKRFHERTAKLCGAWCMTVLGGLISLGLVLALAVGLFADGCPGGAWPLTSAAAKGMVIAATALLAGAMVIVSDRRQALLRGCCSLAVGFLVGNAPQWLAWVLAGVRPSASILPSCPTQIPEHLSLVVDTVAPAILGIPPLHALPQLSPSVAMPWVAVASLALLALLWFVNAHGRSVVDLLALRPLRPADRAPALCLLLLTVPVALCVFGSNAVDVWSARYLVVSWQALALVLGVAGRQLIRTSAPVGLVIVTFAVGQLAYGNLSFLDGFWRQHEDTFSTENVRMLESLLREHEISSGYADYWIAYPLDFLTSERLVLAPYNGIDRYPAYSAAAAAQKTHAYVISLEVMQPGISTPAQLAGHLRGSRWGGGPIHEASARLLERQSLTERQTIGEWEVWLTQDP